MATTEELTVRLEKLRSIRANGLLSITYDGERAEYRNDADLAAAIADLERQLAPSNRPTILYFTTSRGL